VDILQQFGLDLIRALQSFSPALDAPMHFLSFLGGTEFFLIAIPLLYWTLDSRLGIRVFLALLCAYLVVAMLKLSLQQPRPYWLGAVQGLATEPDYAVPSGHASNAMVVFGYLAARTAWRNLRPIAGALIVLVGLSRLYLGVHFPHDVVAGWLVGALVLFAFFRWSEPVAAWLLRQPSGVQMTLVLLVSAAVLPLTWWIQVALLATLARSPNHAITISGALAGAVGGHLLMRRYVRFSVEGSLGQRVARYGVGVVAVAVIYFGLDTFFALLTPDETPLGYALRFVRYATTTLWVTLVAPWIFVRVGLAGREA
jgi:membrane-associated phospholipid phosphatase